MKKILAIAGASLMLFACDNAPKALVEGSVDTLKDTIITLQRYTAGNLTTTDTIKVDGTGCFKAKIKLTGGSPAFYYVSDNGRNMATLVLLPGDKVKVTVAGGDYAVEGSEESTLLKEVSDNFAAAAAKLEGEAIAAYGEKDEARVKELRAEMGKTYVEYRKYAIRYAFTHPRSITSAAIVFQKFNDELPVFGELTDGVIFKQIYDSIQPVYPTSEYVKALKDVMESRTNVLEFSNRLANTPALNFPEINMPDVNGVEQSLTALTGKVIILSFWSVSQNDQKMFNRTLLDIYGKYASRGLEIYQVCLDVDKAAWASTVKSQELPWISVNDGMGNASEAVRNYNISRIPSMYIIDRDGKVVGRDYYDPAELSQVIEKYL